MAEEGLDDLTLWVPYGKWPHQGKESRQDGRSCSLEIGKCGPRTMGQQALGSCSSCLCHYKGQSAWPQWKRRSHVTATHLWSAFRVSLFSLSLTVWQRLRRQRPRFLVHSWGSFPSAVCSELQLCGLTYRCSADQRRCGTLVGLCTASA